MFGCLFLNPMIKIGETQNETLGRTTSREKWRAGIWL